MKNFLQNIKSVIDKGLHTHTHKSYWLNRYCTLMFALGLIFNINFLNAQVRQNIYSLSSTDQGVLADLILEYLDEEVISTHSCNTPMVHGHANFFPFHREYLAGLEDFLILKEYPQFVPLPKWDPADEITTPWQQVAYSDCSSACGSQTCASLDNVGTSSFHSFTNNYWLHKPLCEYLTETELREHIEYHWHNDVHGHRGGVMSDLKSPAAVIFWLFHAYVDDIWKEWECECNSEKSVDLWMRDTPMKLSTDQSFIHTMSMDRGLEPNNQSVPDVMWISEDIWVRNDQTGMTDDRHENPIYNGEDPTYVYIRVRNKGCELSEGDEVLDLRWAKASMGLTWPYHWSGNGTPVLGDLVSTQIIPEIKPGGSAILEFEWYPPNGSDYASFFTTPSSIFVDDAWHFCLLARVLATNDPMAETEVQSVIANTKNNNNVAWKNLTVTDESGSIIIENDVYNGGVVAISNVFNATSTFDIELHISEYDTGVIYEEAQVRLILDSTTWSKWVLGGEQAVGISVYNYLERQLIVTDNNAKLHNLTYDPNQYSTMMVSFNFLVEELTDIQEFFYHVVQHSVDSNTIVGGELYHIKKPSGTSFMANGGEDKQISKGDSIQLYASSINKSAFYNWYSSDGKLVHTGMDFIAKPDYNEKYKLEVIDISNGFKDYDEITVDVKLYEIKNMSPNPTNSDVTVKYALDKAKTASLKITNSSGSVSYNHNLDITKDEIIINVSSYKDGVYSVVLIVDDQTYDSKNLLIQ